MVQEDRVVEGVDGEADMSQSGRDLFAMVGNLGFIQSAIHVPLENFKPEKCIFFKDRYIPRLYTWCWGILQ